MNKFIGKRYDPAVLEILLNTNGIASDEFIEKSIPTRLIEPGMMLKYNLFNKEKAQLCPGNVCEIKDREPIQKLAWHQALIAAIYVVLLLALSPMLASTTSHTKGIEPSVPSSSVSPAEEERCRVPEFAKKIGHEEKWKLHNNCK